MERLPKIAAAGPLTDYQVGMRVLTKEGLPGTVTDVLEGPADLTTIWVALDNGMGGGEYAEAEIQPLSQTQASQVVATEETAAGDYPELTSILSDRLPPQLTTMGSLQAEGYEPGEGVYVGPTWVLKGTCSKCGGVVAEKDGQLSHIERRGWGGAAPADSDHEPVLGKQGSKQATSDEARDWDDAGAHEDMEGDSYVDPPYSKEASASAVREGQKVTLTMPDGHTEVFDWPKMANTHAAVVGKWDAEHGGGWNITFHGSPDAALKAKNSRKFQTDVTVVPFVDAKTAGAQQQPCAKCGTSLQYNPDDGTWPAPDGSVGCDEGGSHQISSVMSADRTAQHLALYLPPKPAEEQGGNLGTSPGEQEGYKDGLAHGREGITRQPSRPEDPQYMAGYDLGWADGVVVNREPANSWDYDDLGRDQIAGPRPELSQAISSVTGALQWKPDSDRFGYMSTDGEWYLERGGRMTHGVNAWLIWRKAKSEEYEVDDHGGYDKRGQATKVIDGVHYIDTHTEGAWLSEAKDICEQDSKQASKQPDQSDQVVIEAGALWDFVKGDPQPNAGWGGVGRQFSYDWCRFRKQSHCWLPHQLNEVASQQAGYAVWIPFDRGFCPRIKWTEQQACPTGEPGPNVPGGFTDATVPWEQGGQRGGQPTSAPADATRYQADPPGVRQSSLQAEAAFEFTAAWKDVRDKAKRIRTEGGVRIVASQDNVIVGHVKGDHGIYETELTSFPGKTNAASWACGCKWAAYSWGRSGPWKRYEGRMCAHALALSYEAASRRMFGRELTLDEKQPAWMEQKHVHRPGDYSRDKQRYSTKISEHFPAKVATNTGGQVHYARVSDDGAVTLSCTSAPNTPNASRSKFSTADPDTEVTCQRCIAYAAKIGHLQANSQQHQVLEFEDNDTPPSTLLAHAMLSEGRPYREVREVLLSLGVSRPADIVRTARKQAFKGKVDGEVIDLDITQDGIVDAAGNPIDPNAVLFPKWHPEYGLHLEDTKLGNLGQGWSSLDKTAGPEDGFYYHTARYDDWPSIRDTGLKPKYSPEVWLYGTVDEAVLLSDSYGNPEVKPCVIVVKSNRPVPGTTGVPGAYVAPFIPPDEIYEVIRPEDIHHYRTSAKKDDGPSVSGVALKAADTGRILMLQRSMEDEKDPARGTWEFPGGHHEDGDTTSLHAGIREWEEEVGQKFPEGGIVTHTWTSPNGIYQGHVVVIPEEKAISPAEGRSVENPDDPDGDYYEAVAWWDPDHARKNPALRTECKDTPWKVLKAAVKYASLVKQADEDQCPYDGSDSLVVDGSYQCDHGHRWSPNDPAAQAFHGDGPQRGQIQPLPKESSIVDLFDEAMRAGPLHSQAAQQAMSDDHWGLEATLDDEPEPALPVTYGDEDDDEPHQVAARLQDALRQDLGVGQITPRQSATQPVESPQQKAARLLNYVDASLNGQDPGGPNPFAHIMAGQQDNEIAAAAGEFLASKTALKDYTPAERKQIIDEGGDDGTKAGNLDRLDITGTHYEALEASAKSPDEDLTFLDGDPNLGID